MFYHKIIQILKKIKSYQISKTPTKQTWNSGQIHPNWMISIFLLSLNIAVNVTFRPSAFSMVRGPHHDCIKTTNLINCLILIIKRCVLTNEGDKKYSV